jgi:L-lactate dehydrogenase complex protein LldF
MRAQFLHRVESAIKDNHLQRALDQNAERRSVGRHAAFESLSDPEGTRLRAHAIRARVIAHLPDLIETFAQNLALNGWHVHHAENAVQACAHITHIAQQQGSNLVIKSKSMVTEEIRLNEHLAMQGIRAIETDLGEFIVQLRDEPPGHIITPAIHLMREDVARTFVKHLGIDFTTDVSALNQAARRTLRQAFLEAGIGISGVNFGIVESGAVCLVTNEGNGRMVTSLPETHIAVMGIERMVPTLNDLVVMLALLPRSATGQILSSYVSWIRSPRRENDLDGPSTRHIILVDNGRSEMNSSPLSSALLCIRCGACLNACPVFREIGGHAYGSVYPGPIGSVVSPGLFGLADYGHLAKASTLCGACKEVCPVDINLPELLLRTRAVYTQQIPRPVLPSITLKLYRWACSTPAGYRTAIKFIALVSRLFPSSDGWIRRLPGPLHAWTRFRDFPGFQSRPFRERFATFETQRAKTSPLQVEEPSIITRDESTVQGRPLLQIFKSALEQVNGEFIQCSVADLGETIRQIAVAGHLGAVLIDPVVAARFPQVKQTLIEANVICVTPCLHTDIDRTLASNELDKAPAGVSLAIAGIAESGSVVVSQDHENAAITSLLPDTNIILLPVEHLYGALENWVQASGREVLSGQQSLTLITGPSRTADIEMTLTIGVHGPARLIVIAFG